MLILMAFIFMLLLLITMVVANLPLYFALLLGLIPFILIALREGSSFTTVKTALWRGFLTPKKVYLIMLLIGLAKPLYTASGSIDYLIQMGTKLISPHSFLLVVFLFTFFMTLLIGSAIGATSLVGVTFMNMASLGSVNLSMTAGAIISAIYIGERASPLSSCANLVAEVSQISLFYYIKANLLSRWKSLLFIVFAYGVLSYFNPLIQNHRLNPLSISLNSIATICRLFPLAVLILYILIKKDLITALVLSSLTSFGIAYFYIGIPLDTLIALMFGELGLLGMFKASLILMSAALLTGLFEGTSLLRDIQNKLLNTLKHNRFNLVFFSSLLGSVIGCSQTFAVLFAKQMASPLYAKDEKSRIHLACDLANTAVLIPAWIPWNVAFSIPKALLSSDYTMLFWAFGITLLPLISYASNNRSFLKKRKNSILRKMLF